MALTLFNTLSRKEEPFLPLEKGTVKMYHCGPTVYDYAHIGNLRPYVFADVLRRTFEYEGYAVKQVINITDVGHLTSDRDEGEDKIEKGARREKKTVREITDFYAEAFFNDLSSLNINTIGTRFPKATDYIEEQIALIKRLEKGGHTYITSDGVYFDTTTFAGYGKLGDIDTAGLKEGARVEKNPEKRNGTDFALWKFSPKGEKRQQEWNSPWGVGFPGWHIECSAMSMKLLGETFDIHTGGTDHIPIHHNDEIAQSESATGKPLAHFWLHSAFVTIEGDKMAKSAGNFIRLQTITDKGFSPLSYRYFLLSAKYRTPLTFSWEALEASQNAYLKLLNHFLNLGEKGTASSRYKELFEKYMEDDLNTPKAVALIWELLKDTEVSSADKKATLLQFDKVLGFDLLRQSEQFSKKLEDVPIPVKNLAAEREQARQNRDFKRSDELRREINKLGFAVEDTPEGQKILPR
jgi:cysteinyl-tRNA synthetase